MLVTLIIIVQFTLSTLAGYAFARFRFPGKNLMFVLVLLQLMIMPDVLIIENYRTLNAMGLIDTIVAIAMPYFGSVRGQCLP
jgi:sn-glycerol 3-phosphate transport system permease protein